MLEKNTETFLGCDANYKNADIVLFGAPFDSSTSFRPGTRFAAKTIRGDSFGLETYSPYQNKDLCDSQILDAGDLELSFGNSELALEQISEFSEQIIADKKIPFMIGGEHLVTLGSFRAAANAFPNICLIQFDAHTDLRDSYLNVSLSHAAVVRRCWDIVGDDRIYQFGIRSGEKHEFEWAKKHTHLQKFNFGGLDECIHQLQGIPVYFTLDLDVLDPSVLPGTGTPEPGGVTFHELHNAVLRIMQTLHIVACDVNELSPVYDASGASTAVACKIIREMLLALQKK